MRKRFMLLSILSLALTACGSEDNGFAPSPNFSFSCVDFVCSFDASLTTDKDGETIFYSWDFGDGTGGAGETPVHAYTKSGELTVLMTATDVNGNSARLSKQITITGNAAAAYYFPIHDGFAIALLIGDVVASAQRTVDALQDYAEVNVGPGDSHHALECSLSGTAEIVSWNDANDNGLIDGTETLEFEAADCSFTTPEDALTSTGILHVKGDFDSDEFIIGHSTTEISRFRIARASRWGVQGAITITTTRTGDEIDMITYSSSDLRTYRLSDLGQIELTIETPIDLSSDFDATTNITGDISIKLIRPLAVAYDIEFQSPVNIESVAGELRMRAGKLNLFTLGDRIDVFPDADPDYLTVEVDKDEDGDIDLNTRFPQSVTVERLEN